MLFSSLLSNIYSIYKCAFVKVEAIIKGAIVFFFKENKNALAKSEAWYSTSMIDGNEQWMICEVGQEKIVLFRRSCTEKMRRCLFSLF